MFLYSLNGHLFFLPSKLTVYVQMSEINLLIAFCIFKLLRLYQQQHEVLENTVLSERNQLRTK